MSQKPAAPASLFAHWLKPASAYASGVSFFVSRNFSKKTSNEFKIKKTQYKVLSF